MIAPVKWVELQSDYLRVAERSAGSRATGGNPLGGRWGAEAHRAVAVVKDFRIGAGNQVAVYGVRVAPVAKSVNATIHEYWTN